MHTNYLTKKTVGFQAISHSNKALHSIRKPMRQKSMVLRKGWYVWAILLTLKGLCVAFKEKLIFLCMLMWEEILAHVAFSPKNPRHLKNRKNNFVFTPLTSLSGWLLKSYQQTPVKQKWMSCLWCQKGRVKTILFFESGSSSCSS